MNRSRTIVGALAMSAVLTLIAAGCGSSGGSDASDDGGGVTTTVAPSSDDSSGAPVALEGKVNDEGTKDISGDGDNPELEIELDDNYFSPTFVKAAPGATVQVSLANEGDNQHTFTLDGGEPKQLAPGDEATVTVTVPESGSLRFSCDFHGSMGMQGAFYSEAAGGSSGGATGGGSGGDTTTTEASSDDGSSGGY